MASSLCSWRMQVLRTSRSQAVSSSPRVKRAVPTVEAHLELGFAYADHVAVSIDTSLGEP